MAEAMDQVEVEEEGQLVHRLQEEGQLVQQLQPEEGQLVHRLQEEGQLVHPHHQVENVGVLPGPRQVVASSSVLTSSHWHQAQAELVAAGHHPEGEHLQVHHPVQLKHI